MTVKAVKQTEGKCTVAIPEFSVSEGDSKRAARQVRVMNRFYLALQRGIIAFASSRDGQGTVRVRGIDGYFESEQTGASDFRIKYIIRGRFLSSDPSGLNSAFRLGRTIITEWSEGAVVSFTVK